MVSSRQEKAAGPIVHYEFLEENTSDPRATFLMSLCRAVEGAGSIVVYNAGFESSRLDDLAQWLPEYQFAIAEMKPSE